jgi:hypothetical protein
MMMLMLEPTLMLMPSKMMEFNQIQWLVMIKLRITKVKFLKKKYNIFCNKKLSLSK